jgi:hypothetical protein
MANSTWIKKMIQKGAVKLHLFPPPSRKTSMDETMTTLAQRLPPDIISQIFRSTMDMLPERGDLPWKLGHICSTWRQVALSDPALWNEIWLPYNAGTSALEVTETRFQRAGARIKLTAKWESETYHDSLVDPLQAYILPYMNRFTSLELSLSSSFLARFLSLPPGLLGALEKIKLSTDTHPYVRAFQPPEQGILLFNGAHELRSVTLLRIVPFNNVASFPQNMQIPWSQLTDLTIRQSVISASNAWHILSRSKRLISCSLGAIEARLPGTSSDIPKSGSIVVPCLEDLTLEMSQDPDMPDLEILTPLVLPSVSKMTLLTPHVRDASPLAALLTRSSCPLVALSIEESELHDLGPVLTSAPFLESLRISCPADLHQVLACTPSLKELWAPTSYLHSQTMSKMAREENFAQIEKITCCITLGDSQAFLETLERICPASHTKGAHIDAQIIVDGANELLLFVLGLAVDGLKSRLGCECNVTYLNHPF